MNTSDMNCARPVASQSSFTPNHPIPAYSSTAAPSPSLVHPARITLDTSALEHNIRTLHSYASHAVMMAVIKGNAYGHGREHVIPAVLRGGAQWLGTAQLAEALTVRQWLDEHNYGRPSQDDLHGTSRTPRILAWIFSSNAFLTQALEADIDLSVSTLSALEQVIEAGKHAGRPPRVHLKIDTGLCRSGATPDDFHALATRAYQAHVDNDICVVGLWSHFSSADDPQGDHVTRQQCDVFEWATRTCHRIGLDIPIRHISATSGIVWHPYAHYDMVRAGIGLYGMSPNPARATSQDIGLRPVMTLGAQLINVKKIRRGQAVSYSRTWTAPTDRWIGIVPLGYADGIPRNIQNRASVQVADRRCPVIGRVCMDQFAIDLGQAFDGDVPPAQVGHTAYLWGSGLHAEPSVEDWAQWEDTISYEVTTRLAPWITRTEQLQLRGA